MNTLQLIRKTFQDWQNKDTPHSISVSCHRESNSYHYDEDKPIIFRWICKIHSPVMVLLSVSTFTGLISYRFYNQPELAVGTISPTKIIAPRNGDFVDDITTEELKKKTRSGLLPVFKQDINLTQKIQIKIEEKLQQIDNIRSLKNNTYAISHNILSLSEQEDLSFLSESQWQQILLHVNNSSSFALKESLSSSENKIAKKLLTYKQSVNSSQ
ncbi:MAG: hypothetical protein FWJ34_02655, partial [Geminocystis sp. GBBB08]|nr:hypothetical protein [Geminocystis sp. GBBB08]